MAEEEDPFDFGFDPDLEDLVNIDIQPGERVAIIRTSDRSNFRRCRRRWGWQSHLRGNLTPIESASPLWFGSGFHYAMEDFHGHNRWGHPKEAFKQYVKATHSQSKLVPGVMPFDWPELTELGFQMCDYYADYWLTARDPYTTYVVDGRPQVEVHALVPVPFKSPQFDRILYGVTIDRVIIDEKGQLWLLDYKTCKRVQTGFFQTDGQISAYYWIARSLYNLPIAGFIYQQHRKAFPDDPRIKATGKISTAKTQNTSHRHYRKTLIQTYGSVLNAPKENVDFLNYLSEGETELYDKYIRRDRIYRNEAQAEAEGAKIMLELEEMLNPNLPLYPNPTRDCGGMCSFSHACVSLDDGSDWEYELQIGFRQKSGDLDSWRQYLPKPQKVLA